MKKFLLLIIGITLCAQEVYCANFNVPLGDTTALISAINISNSNKEADVINLAPNGIYPLNNVFFTSSNPNTTGNASQRGLPLIMNDVDGLDLTINGNGATIIRASTAPNFGIFDISGHTIINDLTIRNGNVNGQGGGIFVEFKGNLELTNCKFFDNVSTLNAEGGGGAIYTKSLSLLKVTGCHFENNSGLNQGGAISNLLSNLYVTNCTFINNKTDNNAGQGDAGGAIYDDGARGDNGEIKIVNSIFENNLCIDGLGGALFLFPYNKSHVEVTGCTFKNNQADQGGAYWHSGGSVTIRDSDYPHTYAPNTDAHTLLFRNCIFDGNTSTSNGGAFTIFKGISTAPISDCTFKNNKSALGGAIFLGNHKPIAFTSSTFNNNLADQAGAIAIIPQQTSATVDLTNCTFDGNIANKYGGGISVPQNTVIVNITNCTFANNQANNPENGQSGAIHSGNNYIKNETVTIKNNIFFKNTVTNPWKTWKHCNCELNDGGNNIFYPENANGRCVTNPNIVDPKVASLSNNGGTTETIALIVGSPAIEAGKDCPTLDQRGAIRNGTCDIGAYEYEGLLTNSLTNNLDIQSLTIYPNPTKTGEFSIAVPETLLDKKIDIRILNGQGTIVRQFEHNINTIDLKIKLGDLPKGLYFVEVNDGLINYSSKILFE